MVQSMDSTVEKSSGCRCGSHNPPSMLVQQQQQQPLGVDGNPSEKYWIFFLGAFGSSEENPIFFLGITITPRGIFQYFFSDKG